MAIFVSTDSESSRCSPFSSNEPGPAGGVAGCNAGTPPGEPEQSPSMAESVTRHALNPLDTNFQYLLCGFDSLDLGLYVDWGTDWPKVSKIFEDYKTKAQGTDGLIEEISSTRKYLFLPGGKGSNYRYHLQFSEYHLFIAKSEKAKKSPNVYLSINSETLWKKGLEFALDLVAADLKYFSGQVDTIVPSRIDICADFKLSAGLSLPFLQQHAVCKSRDISTHMKGEILETCYFGSSAASIRLRIYDKGKEVLKKGEKLWFGDLWGTTDFENIWRVEFQLRRTALKQFAVNNLKDIWKKSGGIWQYLTGEWFSLRLTDNEKTERRTVLPWWSEVQACADRLEGTENVRRELKSDSRASAEFFIAHIAGCLPSFAVRINVKDYREAILRLGKELYYYWDRKDFESEFIKRAIKLGCQFEGTGENHGK